MAKNSPVERTVIDAIAHEEARRANIPTSEMRPLVAEDRKKPVSVAYQRRDPDLDPQLIWRGKYDGDETLTVKAPPLYIQEKIHPKALIEDLRDSALSRSDPGLAEERSRYQLNLFGDFNGMPENVDKTDFYRHEQNWTNRMILGDSLLVMASLAEREGLRGKVQAIYMDPPYGIKFNSNFQWSTNSRDVRDGKIECLTREPEQVKAFRDAWEDGVHSYLSYLRDRFIVARDLLTDSGSIFVQIGDENAHRVRILLDEIFGESNFISQIIVSKTGGMASNFLGNVADTILWYGKNKDFTKYNPLYYERHERNDDDYSPDPILSSGNSQNKILKILYNGKSYLNPINSHWKTHLIGMERIKKSDRIVSLKNTIRFKRYYKDFPVKPYTNIWNDTAGAVNMIYVVQTAPTIIQRCLLMATDPGDLVLDPTCGGGTTAYVAEQWGRRWITIDTSRVALALARARLMGAKYPYYLLADSLPGAEKEAEISRSPVSPGPFGNNVNLGFVYERVPHITLKSIANNPEIDEIWEKWRPDEEAARATLNSILGEAWEEWEIPAEAGKDWPDEARGALAVWRETRLARQREIDASIAARADCEYLYDKPYEDRGKIRVAGPFTVESASPYRTLSLDENDNPLDPRAAPGTDESVDFAEMILDNLRAAGVRQARKADGISFASVTPFAAGRLIIAEGRYLEGEDEKRAAIFIGPEFGTVSREDLIEAAREAGDEKFDILIACAFNFDANAEELRNRGYLPILKARMNAELHMTEALRKTDKGNLFVVFGEPDIDILPVRNDDGGESGEIVVRINGVDVYNPAKGEIVSDNASDVACWMIDDNYNEESFFVRQVYFLGQKNPYDSLRRALNAEIDRDLWESLNSAVSRPFPKPACGRIAVKVINHLGDEAMKVFKV